MKNECCACFWGTEVQRTVSDDGMTWVDLCDRSSKTSWVTCLFIVPLIFLSGVLLSMIGSGYFENSIWFSWNRLYRKWETLQKWSRSYFPRNCWTSPSWGVKKLSNISTGNQVLPSPVSSMHAPSSTQGTWLHLARHLCCVRIKEYE